MRLEKFKLFFVSFLASGTSWFGSNHFSGQGQSTVARLDPELDPPRNFRAQLPGNRHRTRRRGNQIVLTFIKTTNVTLKIN